MQLVLGIGLVVISILGLWIALPRDGEPRAFLKNDHVQSYYAIAIIGAFCTGVINVLLAFVTQ